MSAIAVPSNKIHPMLSGLRHAEMRGRILSHLIGFSVFFLFIFDRAITYTIPYNKMTDLPIRLLAVWLIIDRIGRRGKVKVSGWDYVHLGFVALYGFALVYADLFMRRDTGLLNYVEWMSSTMQPYLFFLVCREGTFRRGFQPYVIVQWILGTIAIACVIGLLQATNVAGLRIHIDNFVNQRMAEMRMEGPSQPWQARGVFRHANSLAIMLIMAFALLIGAANYRKPRLFEYACGALFLVTMFATYSRTGIASVFLMMLAVVGMLFFQRKYKVAFTTLLAMGTLLFTFVTLVVALDIKRYQVFVQGAGVIKNEESRGLQGWYLREQTLKRAMEIAQKYPLTGVGVATNAINQERVYHRSAFTFEGLLLNVYGYTFVMFGFIGIAYLVGCVYLMLRQFKYIRTNLAFAAGAAMCGVAIVITGISENTLWQAEHMVVVNIIMAFALQKIVRPEEAPNPVGTAETRPYIGDGWIRWWRRWISY